MVCKLIRFTYHYLYTNLCKTKQKNRINPFNLIQIYAIIIVRGWLYEENI